MKVLVTGATGFLGSHLCQRLVNDGHEVTAFCRQSSDIAPIADLNLKYAVGDVTDPGAIEHSARNQDVAIHAAAEVGWWGRRQQDYEQANVRGTRNVASACKQKNVRLVHVSSVAAVGIPPGPNCPADETFQFNLQESGMTYHLSKRLAEETVLEEAAGRLDAVVVNPALIFGPKQGGYQGADLLAKPLRNRVILHGPGGQCIVHVSDVVDGIVLALQHGRKGERYILGGDNVSFREMNEVVCEQLALRRLLIPIPGGLAEAGNRAKNQIHRLLAKQPLPVYDRRFCHQFYDSTKAKSELGYHPLPLGTIVKECVIRAGWLVNGSNGDTRNHFLTQV